MENKKEQSVNIQLPKSNTDDTVDNIFRIHLNEEVVELSNEFCKYYYATDDSEQDEFFAIVFENNFIPRINVLEFLSKTPIAGLNNVLAYSIVRLSTTKEEHLVAIVNSYDTNSTLASQLQHGQTIKLQEIEKIVESINNILINLKDEKIFCCNISPSNILMKDGKFYGLREFIDTYPNFHQEEQYLAPELIECHRAARYVKNPLSDIYALGISMFEAYTNKPHWNDHPTMQDYNHARFENSTNKYLLGRVKVPERLRTFLKWTMHDDASVRWKTSKIKEWIEGKNSNSTHESLADTKNIIGFKENNYSTLKSLAYALYNSWTDGMKFIKDTKLFKWASREQLSSDSLEAIQAIVDKKSESPFVVTNTLGLHIKLSKLLSLIDYNGSIRQEGLALSASSIPFFIHNLVMDNNKDVIEKVIKIMKDEDWKLYSSRLSASGHLNRSDSDNFVGKANNVQSGSIARGIERLSYSLNPTLVCQSKLLKGKYVTNIQELLIGLDSYAEKHPKNFTIDRHIIAFIAAKLDLKEDVKAAILPNFPKFSEHPVIRGLSILNLLQQHEPSIEIPNICKAISSDLKKMFEEHLHNVEFKKQTISKIDEISKEGSLEQIIQMLSDQQQFINDYNGYYEACRQAKIIEQKIKALNNQDSIFNGALLLGQKTTVLLSYVLCFIVTVTVII